MVASNYVILLSGNQRSVQVSIVPQQPPSYTEPSHKPPTYEEAISQHIGQNVHVTYPGMVPSITDEYAYQPPRKYISLLFDCHIETGLRANNTFSCWTHLGMKIILFINVKMPTIVGIFNIYLQDKQSADSFKARKIIIFSTFLWAFEIPCSVE